MNEGKQKVHASQENYRKEYDVVSASWRFFVSLRFIVAAFATTLQTALLTLYGQAVQPSVVQTRATTLLVVGLATMVAITIIELRNITLFRTMERRGKELEFNLGLTNGHFSRLSELELVHPRGWRRIVTHSWGISLIYGIISALWVALLIFG